MLWRRAVSASRPFSMKAAAFGLEALSRGAKDAVFIENSRAALSVLRRNIAELGETGRTEIIAADATQPPRALAPAALAALAAAGWLTPEALAIVEVAAREAFAAPGGFTVIDERVYGAARLVFLRYDGASR